MTLHISSVFTYDEDAGNYIQAVEAADGQVLEGATRKAINNFVIGCKQDGIWDAIKASCILAGARTLSGALIPLAGTAPTNYNFVAGDYNRKTGLVGDGSTKYLDSNRNNNADPQNNQHLSAYLTSSPVGVDDAIIGAGVFASAGNSYLLKGGAISIKSQSASNSSISHSLVNPTELFGVSRNNSSNASYYLNGVTTNAALASTSLFDGNILVFSRGGPGSISSTTDARIAFYSIGESLDLALLDARVTDLITEFGAAIP